jgi:uncharacterized protein (AIM24 family)
MQQPPHNDLRYNVILTGRVIENAPVQKAMAGLAQVLRLSEQQVAVAFAKAPVVVKRHIDSSTAHRIQAVLQQLHLEVIVQLADLHAAEPVGKSANLATILSENSGSTDDSTRFAIEGNPDHGVLTLQIAPGGAIYGDSSAIVCLDANIKMRRGDEASGLGTRYAAYINRFCADDQSGEVCLAAKLPGEIRCLTITTPLRLRVSCYLASSVGIRFTQGEAPNTECPVELHDRFLQCEGPGAIWLSACGGIVQTELTKSFLCRTDRILAWQGNISFNGNHDELTEIRGTGILWLQTLSETALSAWAKSIANG